ncbi:hypothetical protein FPOA_02036 [Fusarium poae]|uniref:Uncharacterized protein n=2 Tax=Fusarium poae TaxID=36050 RepID=A0A1B8B5W0_FUSPO|nr:hypothetical protein FPOA_02036 [Fusarium poae]
MPPEIIVCIVDSMLKMNHGCEQPARWTWADDEPEPYFNPLHRYKDALSLATTCKALYNLLIKQIYRTDVRNNKSAALLRSAKMGSLEGVKRSLEAGANVDIGDTTMGTVSRDIARFCLSMDGEVHELYWGAWHPFDMSGQATAIHWAAYWGHKDIVSLLLERGADVNHRVHVKADTFYCDIVDANVEDGIICLKGVDEEVARWTLEHGANPLYFAIKGGDWDTIHLLIHAGAEFVTHTGCGIHALHQAVSNGDTGLVESLLQHESVVANLNTILDSRGATALHYLNYISDDDVENCRIIRKLVEHDFLVNTTDGYDALPIQEAILQQSNIITTEFIRYGSLIPEEFASQTFDGNFIQRSDIMKALQDAEDRGFTVGIHHPLSLIAATFSARVRTYRHFFKLVYRTGEVPLPMNSYGPDRWETFWAMSALT